MTMFNCFRFIALHAGNSTGLGHLWYLHTNNPDYHGETNQEFFFWKIWNWKIDNIVKELYASIIMK
jgi:hypothetical protein